MCLVVIPLSLMSQVSRLEEETVREKQEFEDAFIQNDVEVETLSEHVVSLERILISELHEVTCAMEEKGRQVQRFCVCVAPSLSCFLFFLLTMLLGVLYSVTVASFAVTKIGIIGYDLHLGSSNSSHHC